MDFVQAKISQVGHRKTLMIKKEMISWTSVKLITINTINDMCNI